MANGDDNDIFVFLGGEQEVNMADGDDDDIFVYLGGEQEVPDEITHAIIDPSVNIVRTGAFVDRQHLVSVIFHAGVEVVEYEAFCGCYSLSGRIKLLGVREIRQRAFHRCLTLSSVEFGGRLETIGMEAFCGCHLLRSIKLPSVRNVQDWAFVNCDDLNDVEFGINLETIGIGSFNNCPSLQRIVIPLKIGLFSPDPIEQRYTQFDDCHNLATVDLVGAEGKHNTISSLLLESWKDEMNQEIDRINQELPNIPSREKTDFIRLWIRSVINGMEHYKAEHRRLLKEHMTLLELAVWKAKLDERDDDSTQRVQTKRARIDEVSSREDKRITSGADTIIKNVLPFLKLL